MITIKLAKLRMLWLSKACKWEEIQRESAWKLGENFSTWGSESLEARKTHSLTNEQFNAIVAQRCFYCHKEKSMQVPMEFPEICPQWKVREQGILAFVESFWHILNLKYQVPWKIELMESTKSQAHPHPPDPHLKRFAPVEVTNWPQKWPVRRLTEHTKPRRLTLHQSSYLSQVWIIMSYQTTIIFQHRWWRWTNFGQLCSQKNQENEVDDAGAAQGQDKWPQRPRSLQWLRSFGLQEPRLQRRDLGTSARCTAGTGEDWGKMLADGSWWFLVIFDDLWWCVMMCDDACMNRHADFSHYSGRGRWSVTCQALPRVWFPGMIEELASQSWRSFWVASKLWAPKVAHEQCSKPGW